MHLRALYLLISLFVRLELSRGVLVNRTIDDQFGDSVTGVLPTYGGYGGSNWAQGATCQKCRAQPDPSSVFQGSWHDTTWSPGDSGEKVMTVNFNGSAVYVFIILANNLHPTTTFTNLSFSLDGELVGNFVHSPTSGTDYEYNVTAYANESLANVGHNLVMQTTGDNAVLVLFDYLVYSVDDEGAPANDAPPSTQVDSSSETGKKDIGIIVGALIGGLIAFTLAIGLPLYSYVHSGRTLTGPPVSSDWGETFTGTRMSSSMLPGTHTNSTYRDRSSFVQSTIMSQEQRQGRSRVTHIQSASMHAPELQARTKSAERRLDLARQAAYIGRNGGLILPKAVLNLGSGQTRRHEMKPPEDVDDAEVLQEQIVLLLDEVERLLVQREMAETFRARDER
ncbi:hypothetical protein M0805_009065 [Coniferiporia weirii]|nr:hypothetical protein M0805_009065 [Coniferiporia weirii]